MWEIRWCIRIIDEDTSSNLKPKLLQHSRRSIVRARHFPLPDSPGQVKLPVGQVDLNRFFLFISYKQIEEFQNSWSRASADFEKRQALIVLGDANASSYCYHKPYYKLRIVVSISKNEIPPKKNSFGELPNCSETLPWLSLMISSHQYRYFHCGDTVLKPSYLHYENSDTQKTYHYIESGHRYLKN